MNFFVFSGPKRKPMAKEKIPVYNIASLTTDPLKPSDFFIEQLGNYLDRHPPNLHAPHRHSFYHFVCFTKGKGSHTLDFTRFDVKPGQIYFMIPGQVHGWNFEGRPDGYIVHFSEAFFHPFLADPAYLSRFPFFSGVATESVCQLAHPEKIYELLHTLLTERQPDMVRVLLLQLFLSVASAEENTQRNTPPQKQTQLNNLRRLIEQHYRTMRLPKEYAELLHVTPHHLNALCQELLGMPAGELIRDRVLLEARRLLINADMTVSEIAYDLNFQDNSYFNRFFKKYIGATPDEFRRQYIH
jgi:AraC family transcriptional regulator, transcriptional activator of pobA